jgi:hypothetical protein
MYVSGLVSIADGVAGASSSGSAFRQAAVMMIDGDPRLEIDSAVRLIAFGRT